MKLLACLMKRCLHMCKDTVSIGYCLICINSCSIWSAVVMMRVAAE